MSTKTASNESYSRSWQLMRSKWKPREIAALFLEIASPAASIAVACLLPTSNAMSIDQRLAVVVGGIAIPIVMLQFSLTKSIKTVSHEISEVDLKVDSASEMIGHISPVLESVIRSDNDKLQRFAFRRLDEAYDTVIYALNNNNSGDLKPNEYYEELLYLSSLILKDKDENKDKFAGEIWAMTGFAENEWVADEGYERLWSDRLKEMAVANIPTKRLCLIHAELYEMLMRQPFVVPPDSDERYSSFWSFVGFLEDYYCKNDIKTSVNHYFIRDSDNDMLSSVRGFFCNKAYERRHAHFVRGNSR